MIEGFSLASRDIGSFSDPYLILRCGNKTFNERENYILDEPDPKFYKHYDFEALFPGCPMLFIDAFDYDDLFGDDLIGTTQVDLEDRYFLPEWRALCHKPVEYRQIYHPSSLVSQGQLKLWVEINKVNVTPDKQEPLYDIRAKPPEEFQLRLCVFETKEIKMMDFEGTSDVYIRAFFDSRKDALETDTHYRCQTGNASFNYRLVYKMEHPRKDYRMTLQAYDRDFFKSNDIIGNTILDLKQPFEDVSLTKRPLQVNKKYFNDYMRKPGEKDMEWHDEESFWLPLTAKNDQNVLENNGYVRVRVDIVPAEYAAKNPVGSAREDPNIEPYLPPPVGRITFSLNPCAMYKQLVGPAARRKICIWLSCFFACLLACLILYYVVPVVIGNVITNTIL